jgi:hypothetical protein
MVYFQLADGREIGMPLEWSERLTEATPEQRSHWRLIGGGVGVHWPASTRTFRSQFCWARIASKKVPARH